MIAIQADNVGKRYARRDENRTWTLQDAVFSGFRHLRPRDHFWSLRHVTFSVEGGRALGVVGRNGAGKSTLLRLIGGIGRPDEGSLRVNGKLGGLLELTAGFHGDLTGRQNAITAGVLRGLTRKQVLDRFDSILDFSELHDSIDRPLRTYSTGMQMRLAFAVAIHAEPDVLLVDEVLAVGDLAFQRRCMDRIWELRERGCTIVLVSHDPDLVRDMCDDALWLNEGRVEAYGPAKSVVREYVASFENETWRKTPVDFPPVVTSQGVLLRAGENRFGPLDVRLTDVRLLTGSDPSGLELMDGGSLVVEIDYAADRPVEQPIFGITVLRDDGSKCFDANTEHAALNAPIDPAGGHLSVRLDGCRFGAGTYYVDVGVYEHQWRFAYDYHARCYPIVVRHARAAAVQQDGEIGQPSVEWVYNPARARSAGACQEAAR